MLWFIFLDCIVAPYEADAQLAFLFKSGLVNLIISEDSDLTLFGCEKIIFKLDSYGNGTLCEMSKLNESLGNHASNFTFEKFRYMCIMSGCDYLSSLHGIGLGKSQKFWSKVTQLDLRKVLAKIPGYLNMPQLTVTPEYIDGFIQANQTFLYQLVFDPKEKLLRPLNEYQDGLNAQDLPFCGEVVQSQLALGLALGNINLQSLEKVSDFDPDQPPIVEKPRYGRRSTYPSIWCRGFKLEQVVTGETTTKEKVDRPAFQNCFSVSKPKNKSDLPKASVKRKREPSPALICTPEEVNKILDEDIAATEKDIFNAYNSEKKIVYKSRYFKTKSPCKSKTTGDWLEKIEMSNQDDGQLNYHPDLIKDKGKDSGSMEVLKRPFKPVAFNSEELVKKRNPFVKTRTPEKRAKFDIRNKPLSINADELQNSPLLVDDVISNEKTQNKTPEESAKIDIRDKPLVVNADELQNSPLLSDDISIEKEQPKHSPVKDVTNEAKNISPYFSKQPVQQQKQPRGLSGLTKPIQTSTKKKSVAIGRGQKSLLDMWKKR